MTRSPLKDKNPRVKLKRPNSLHVNAEREERGKRNPRKLSKKRLRARKKKVSLFRIILTKKLLLAQHS